jgi:LPXTG-motif cell wall-anchored protein
MTQASTLEPVDYTPPVLTYHGRVGDLTQAEMLEMGVGAVRLAGAFAVSVVGPPGVPGDGVPTPNVTDTPPDGGGTGGGGAGGGGAGVSPEGGSGGPSGETVANGGAAPAGSSGGGSAPAGGASSGGGAGASGAGDDGDGNLPYTGIAIAWMAAAGVGLASAGGVIRKVTRRQSE